MIDLRTSELHDLATAHDDILRQVHPERFEKRLLDWWSLISPEYKGELRKSGKYPHLFGKGQHTPRVHNSPTHIFERMHFYTMTGGVYPGTVNLRGKL